MEAEKKRKEIVKDLERPSANAKAFFGKSMPKPPVRNKFVSKVKKNSSQ